MPPEGQGTPSGTGSPPSLPLFTPPLSTSPPSPLPLSLSLPLLFPFLAAPRTTGKPPYAPSGSYLRVLLIFSYYRRGHVGMFRTQTHTHTHTFANPARTYTGYGPSRGSPDSPSFVLSTVPYVPLVSPSPSPLSVLLSGTPICEHIITEESKRRAGGTRESWGVSLSLSLSRGSKDEVKRTRVLPVDEENARVSERSCKGV